MKSEKDILQNILRLDSIYKVLLNTERYNVRGKLLGRHWNNLSEPVKRLVSYLQENDDIEIPELKVGQDRLTYVVKKNELIEISKYYKMNTSTLNKIIEIMGL